MTKHKIQNKSKFQMSNHKTFVLLFVIMILNLFCALNFVICHYCYAEDKIIAIVNNDIITQRELSDFINFTRMQLSQEYKGEELESKIQSLKLDLMDKLIEDRLILQEAKKNNLQINEEAIKARVEEIKKRYASDEQFQKTLAQQGFVQADIESKIREQLLMYHIVDIKIRKKIMISPTEVTAFYQANMQELMIPEQREIETITIADEATAKEISKSLKNGRPLEEAAGKYSLNIDKMTVVKGQELRKDIEDVVFKLNLGETSGPVKIEENFYIFKLGNIFPPRQQTLVEIQDKLYNFLFNKKMQEEMVKWVDDLRQHAFIKIMQD